MSVLDEIVKPIVERMGYEFVGLEVVSQTGHSVLRIYMDSEQGVDVADCGEVSKQVGAVLEVEGAMKGAYTLEVSSPGLERRLFTVAQCEKQVGKQVKLKLATPNLEGRRNFAGELRRIEGSELFVEVDGTECQFHFSDVEKIQTVITW